jgi:hypothetical protein
MSCRLKTLLPREPGKWGVYALALFVPGSFVVLPLWWLVSRFRRPRRAAGYFGWNAPCRAARSNPCVAPESVA